MTQKKSSKCLPEELLERELRWNFRRFDKKLRAFDKGGDRENIEQDTTNDGNGSFGDAASD